MSPSLNRSRERQPTSLAMKLNDQRAALSRVLCFFDRLCESTNKAYSQRDKSRSATKATQLRGLFVMFFRILAALPFIGILIGIPFVNQVEPLVLGMPFVLAWIVIWIVLSAIIMGIIYRLDPANRQAVNEAGEART
jgi:uncharacterized BrkB/YihY/UPF0761 family membrane protein